MRNHGKECLATTTQWVGSTSLCTAKTCRVLRTRRAERRREHVRLETRDATLLLSTSSVSNILSALHPTCLHHRRCSYREQKSKLDSLQRDELLRLLDRLAEPPARYQTPSLPPCMTTTREAQLHLTNITSSAKEAKSKCHRRYLRPRLHRHRQRNRAVSSSSQQAKR